MTNKEVVQKASCAMKLLDQWAAVTEPYANDETKQLVFQRAHGSLEVHLAACALDKKNRTHDKMEDAARQVLQDFANEIGVALATPSQWGQTQKKPSPKQPPSSNTILREYNDKGVLTNAPAVMASMGFAVGSQVQRGSTVAKIDRVQGDEVRLTVEDSKVFVSAASFIANEWKQYSEPKPQLEVTWLQHSELGLPTLSGEGQSVRGYGKAVREVTRLGYSAALCKPEGCQSCAELASQEAPLAVRQYSHLAD